ncbi:DNA polymerase III subunit gamma/tau [Acuticoccus sp. MNP-M23]|uniref:DNA polymerase III subunit gamma/tau n=1 Tax=Acuticoccus sp. MNP-M23 TaxID=3072793 RepID=UPI0028159709|nr:DNA polymerase III subunit gamma/tau [Acuticoccus sp. MNP-M23]WMS41056.1 DNA polymerase III subunit gamma/tau [Acuticoccus sp. MNP-M23]
MADATLPDPAPAAEAGAYRVLARKYRPSHFGELIGQEPMVRTLRNAFAHQRIPQAWMLTGVRGVGKTTTARILARALNYERDGEPREPTVDFTEPGRHCQAIMEGRHVDVIEMDAASHTGINDIREITDAARYKPVSALYKVYIIDEVHMLSTAAFNGLLKTLEEPPAHVKFIFATTEIRKVPVTVLSRCQRFDLRRIEVGELSSHLARVATAEGVTVDEPALAMIARAAEGSVRDSLSLLDQAIAHGGGNVSADDLRDMLGLADRARVVDLFELVMKGEAAGALAELGAQYEVGADPVVVLSDLAAFVHQVTRQKVTNAPPEPGEPETVRERSAVFAGTLGMAALSRMWQALLAGIAEVQTAPKPVMAAEMVLIRLCYMASLPEPDGLPFGDAPAGRGGGAGGGGTHAPAAPARAAPVASAPAGPEAQARKAPPQPQSFAAVARLLEGNVMLRRQVERDMRLVSFEPGRIEVSLLEDAEPTVAGALGQKLTELTRRRWIVTVSEGSTAPTLHEAFVSEQVALKEDAKSDPLVRALLERFADAEITEVRKNEDAPAGKAARSEG